MRGDQRVRECQMHGRERQQVERGRVALRRIETGPIRLDRFPLTNAPDTPPPGESTHSFRAPDAHGATPSGQLAEADSLNPTLQMRCELLANT